MTPRRNLPLLLVVCRAMVEAASRLVPSAHRLEWKQEWHAEIWHRWQFLLHAGAWSGGEAFGLLRRCAGVWPDAIWHLAGQDAVQGRIREWIRSPWTCLGTLAFVVCLAAAFSSGLPATWNMLHVGINANSRGLVYIWVHPVVGGGDQGLPPDVVPAWADQSRLLEGVAPFAIAHRVMGEGRATPPLIVRTQASLFQVLRAKPLIGRFPSSEGLVLSHRLWRSIFHADPRIVGKEVRVGHELHRVVAVLPNDFQFLSREPSAFLVQRVVPDAEVMAIGRLKPGVSEQQLDKELIRIAEVACYYFFKGQLRYSFLADAAWIPLRAFGVAAIASALLLLAVSRVSLRRWRRLLKAQDRTFIARRVLFFAAKVGFAFVAVFVAVLEWSRSDSAIVYGSKDPAAGPFLLWLYILGTMAVLFWALADQRARCRVCLRLLCFPVRVGCPGCLLLNWSGTELLCSEGHGLLHVPHLAPSWDEESERWISLDESWKDLFAETK